MDSRVAKALMNENCLIPRRVSRSLLNAIAGRGPDEGLEQAISGELLHELQAAYQNKLRELGNDPRPRNLPFYLMIKERYPSFDWVLATTEQQRRNSRRTSATTLAGPRIRGLTPSLATLLIGLEREADDTGLGVLPRRYPVLLSLPAEVQRILENLFVELDLSLPDLATMRGLVEWIKFGLSGRELTAFFPVCPDYAYERSDSALKPYRYTFDGLGCGIGLVAKRAMAVAPKLVKSLARCDIQVRVVVGGGDFEAFAESTLRRLNIGREEFLRRVGLSLQAFKRQCPVLVDTVMITEVCGGAAAWKERCHSFRTRFAQGDYGAAGISFDDLLQILETRAPLYAQWHGMQKGAGRFLNVLLDQGAEYASLGSLGAHNLRDCFIVGCDHSAMAPFYRVAAPNAPLYLKPVY